MWHICEEAYSQDKTSWEEDLFQYCRKLARKYPLQNTQITHWFDVCRLQFPIYIKYKRKHPDTIKYKSLAKELVFSIPYDIGNGREVLLKGKFDGIDKGNRRIRLQEHKTKGDIPVEQLNTQLLFDLQTMFYLTALHELIKTPEKLGLKPNTFEKNRYDIRYNVIRRPLSGGKHSIRRLRKTKTRKVEETNKEFYARLGEAIEGDADYFFKRWDCCLTRGDLEKFADTFLKPILNEVWDWWDWIKASPHNPYRKGNKLHWRYPYGVYNPTLEGRAEELDNYLNTGSTIGLEKADRLFPEL